MQNYSTFVGMDVHKQFIQAHVHACKTGEVLDVRVDNDQVGINKLVKQTKRIATGEIIFCYEAGSCGFDISRKIQDLGYECQVIAPTLIPIKPGERIKNDRRDAIKLANYLQTEMLTPVHQPTPGEEALRNLCRTRLQESGQLTRCRHWILKFCLRQGLKYPGKCHWTDMHLAWLRRQKFSEEYNQDVFDDYLLAFSQTQERLKALEEKILKAAHDPRIKTAVDYLLCFRGIREVTAMTLVSEIQDINRFENARKLMGYSGLTVGEHSSADTKKARGITKAGNCHIRRILTEGAWTYRLKPRLSKALAKRQEGKPAEVKAIADKAQHRLYKKYWRMVQGGKSPNKAVTAVCRELLGFVWSALKLAKNEQENKIFSRDGRREKITEPSSASRLPHRTVTAKADPCGPSGKEKTIDRPAGKKLAKRSEKVRK